MSNKVICLDIETSPNVGYTWGRYDQAVIKQIRGWELLSFAYKELGRGKVKCLARCDFKDKSEKTLVKEAWKILDDCAAAIAHNGVRFDFAKLRAKFVQHELPPPRPFKEIDTKKIAKSHFGFYSNSLNDIARDLGLGEKIETGGFELWEGCMANEPRAWAKMKRYNAHDVTLLEMVYLKLRAWHPTHPNLALVDIGGTVTDCPVCSSEKVQRRGYNVARTRRQARLHCQDCGHWFNRALSNVA